MTDLPIISIVTTRTVSSVLEDYVKGLKALRLDAQRAYIAELNHSSAHRLDALAAESFRLSRRIDAEQMHLATL